MNFSLTEINFSLVPFLIVLFHKSLQMSLLALPKFSKKDDTAISGAFKINLINIYRHSKTQ